MRKKISIILLPALLTICKAFAHDTTGFTIKIDTITVKGYYLVQRMKREAGSNVKLTRDNAGAKHLDIRIDSHIAEKFIPDDSLKKNQLAFYLVNFFANTNQVYINCTDNEYLLTKITQRNQYGLCKFKLPVDSNLYEMSDFNSQDVFGVYYIEATALKFELRNVFSEKDMIKNKIAQLCIDPTAKTFEVICLTEIKYYDQSAPLNLKSLKIWKQDEKAENQ